MAQKGVWYSGVWGDIFAVINTATLGSQPVRTLEQRTGAEELGTSLGLFLDLHNNLTHLLENTSEDPKRQWVSTCFTEVKGEECGQSEQRMEGKKNTLETERKEQDSKEK